ncbi:MAG TPA: D-alanine--D-alanine ligase family protein [Ktedonobacteraceae bacterium]
MTRLRVGMIFGGRSVEHEVSILTAHQAMAALPIDRYLVIPIYIAKSGQWFTGEALLKLENFKNLDQCVALAEPVIFSADATKPGLVRQSAAGRSGWFGNRQSQSVVDTLDVAFPLLHGSHGEDGTIQGLLELANLPYVGSGVVASAIGMDKVLSKMLLRSAGLPVIDELFVSRARWESAPDAVLAEVESRFRYPVFVKPASLGSSVGVSRVEDAQSLRFALDVAATYDGRLMIEPAQVDIIEVNCSVLGHGADVRASVCEQPLSSGGVLSYEDKYLSGKKSQGMKSANRIIPAPLAADLTKNIQQAAMRAFTVLNASGVARLDFFVQPATGTYYINEINTLPGSLAFYLWEPSGVTFPELLDTLITLAGRRQQEKSQSTFAFSSSLLGLNPLQSTKITAR